jgi:hypothetical protein
MKLADRILKLPDRALKPAGRILRSAGRQDPEVGGSFVIYAGRAVFKTAWWS